MLSDFVSLESHNQGMFLDEVEYCSMMLEETNQLLFVVKDILASVMHVFFFKYKFYYFM